MRSSSHERRRGNVQYNQADNTRFLGREHVKVNLALGVYNDFRKSQGGTVQSLIRDLGGEVPAELRYMGYGDIPEFFPLWALGNVDSVMGGSRLAEGCRKPHTSYNVGKVPG